MYLRILRLYASAKFNTLTALQQEHLEILTKYIVSVYYKVSQDPHFYFSAVYSLYDLTSMTSYILTKRNMLSEGYHTKFVKGAH